MSSMSGPEQCSEALLTPGSWLCQALQLQLLLLSSRAVWTWAQMPSNYVQADSLTPSLKLTHHESLFCGVCMTIRILDLRHSLPSTCH